MNLTLFGFYTPAVDQRTRPSVPIKLHFSDFDRLLGDLATMRRRKQIEWVLANRQKLDDHETSLFNIRTHILEKKVYCAILNKWNYDISRFNTSIYDLNLLVHRPFNMMQL